MKKFFLAFLLPAVMLCLTAAVSADVRVTNVFTDNAVLQRDLPIKVWGWANPGEKVTVTFAGESGEYTACPCGIWLVPLPAMPANTEGQDLVISGKNNTLTFTNVLVGDLWICSGQSNMEWTLGGSTFTEEEMNGDYSLIRFNRANHIQASSPQDELTSGGWIVCKDGAQRNTTAVGFYFAARLLAETGVPIGLIDSNWGGSNIDSWIPDEGWFLLPELEDRGNHIKAKREKGEEEGCGGMYYKMLAPWRHTAIKGAIWYQGCSNTGEGGFYYYKQKAMITEWRNIWGQGDFPFYWVQLANFTAANDNPNDSVGWALLRDGQTRCMEVVNSGQAVIIDIGEAGDIHPRNKFDVGNRLALWALAKDFGKDLEPCSPMFKELKVDGNKAVVTFDHVGGGLVVGKKDSREPMTVDADGTLQRFAVAGEDLKFFWADAKIVGKDTVELTAAEVENPVAVRYAWQINPEGCNLFSAEGLPATPFRTDEKADRP